MKTNKQQQFSEAYDRCHDQFIRYCSALSFGKMDTEDLVQDVLVSVYKNFEKIEDKQQMLHYLIRTARNIHISKWRRNKKVGDISQVQLERLQHKGASAEDLVDVSFLYAKLNLLPEKQRSALILFEVSGFSFKEIAQIQKSSEGAVKTLVSRGRKKLRELMEDDGNAVPVSQYLGTLKSIML